MLVVGWVGAFKGKSSFSVTQTKANVNGTHSIMLETNGWDEITDRLIKTVFNLLGPSNEIPYFSFLTVTTGYLFIPPLLWASKTFIHSDNVETKTTKLKREINNRRWDSNQKMSWQTYVDDHLMCEIDGHHLTSAAIIGLDGSVWAQSSSFPQVRLSFIFIFRFYLFDIGVWFTLILFCSVFSVCWIFRFSIKKCNYFCVSIWSIFVILSESPSFPGKIDFVYRSWSESAKYFQSNCFVVGSFGSTCVFLISWCSLFDFMWKF